MGELLVRFIKSVIHIVCFHRITCSPKLFNGFGTSTGLILVIQGGVALPTLKRTYCIVLKKSRQRVPELLLVEWVCLIVPSGRFCMSSNYTLTIPYTCSRFSRFCTPFLFLYVVPTPLCERAAISTTGILHR